MLSKDQNSGLVISRTHSFLLISLLHICKFFLCVYGCVWGGMGNLGVFICMCVCFQKYIDFSWGQCLFQKTAIFLLILVLQQLSIQLFFHLAVGWNILKWKLNLTTPSLKTHQLFSAACKIQTLGCYLQDPAMPGSCSALQSPFLLIPPLFPRSLAFFQSSTSSRYFLPFPVILFSTTIFLFSWLFFQSFICLLMGQILSEWN